MPNEKGNDRLNEVMGSRSADGLTECEADTLNSAPMGQRCLRCLGLGDIYIPTSLFHGYIDLCPRCKGTGREAPHGAERRPISNSTTPPVA